MSNFETRKAHKSDLKSVVSLIRELAEFEKLLDDCKITEELLEKAIFNKDKFVELLVAEVNSKIKGYAIFFYNFSTFSGEKGLFLEDIYVQPDARKTGIGKALVDQIIKIGLEENCSKFEGVVLDWNTNAKKFYQDLGAKPLSDWVLYRLQK
ncbi:UNVERIFIED_CONTAM: hypothetical protein GTU68_064475 [Idotea baltica]|nr:hypothetical protein [Idotea baltica]